MRIYGADGASYPRMGAATACSSSDPRCIDEQIEGAPNGWGGSQRATGSQRGESTKGQACMIARGPGWCATSWSDSTKANNSVCRMCKARA